VRYFEGASPRGRRGTGPGDGERETRLGVPRFSSDREELARASDVEEMHREQPLAGHAACGNRAPLSQKINRGSDGGMRHLGNREKPHDTGGSTSIRIKLSQIGSELISDTQRHHPRVRMKLGAERRARKHAATHHSHHPNGPLGIGGTDLSARYETLDVRRSLEVARLEAPRGAPRRLRPRPFGWTLASTTSTDCDPGSCNITGIPGDRPCFGRRRAGSAGA
jgi:hypothetical protein